MVKKYFLIIFLNIFLKFLTEDDYLCYSLNRVTAFFSQASAFEECQLNLFYIFFRSEAVFNHLFFCG